ncbi:MAG: dockerin type I repeat-containing protein [Planctomycetes bacterium]|nr:dockerin type I repeat-containing protein [Planctomycetota bacterium]
MHTKIWSLWIGLAFFGGAHSALAHCQLDAPNGGESFQVGDNVSIEWHVTIPHDLLAWNLWYSTESDAGPWIEIATGLPAESPAVGVPHFYDWTIPSEAAGSTVWVRVMMDNGTLDYFDESDAPFTIIDPTPAVTFVRGDANGDGGINVGDPVAILAQLFEPSPPTLPCDDAADTNGDGAMDIADAVYALSYLFLTGSPEPPAPFPDCGVGPGIGALGCASSICTP